jgi:hypothetical protein
MIVTGSRALSMNPGVRQDNKIPKPSRGVGALGSTGIPQNMRSFGRIRYGFIASELEQRIGGVILVTQNLCLIRLRTWSPFLLIPLKFGSRNLHFIGSYYRRDTDART